MKKYFFSLSFLLISISLYAQKANTTKEFLDLCFGSKFKTEQAYNYCSDNFKSKVTLAQFDKSISQVRNLFGESEKFLDSCSQNRNIYCELKHSKSTIIWKVVLNADSKIEGFTIHSELPCRSEANSSLEELNYTIRELTIQSENSKVKGRLTIPKYSKQFPLVLLLQGSGKHTSKYKLGKTSYFEYLSDILAEKGIATFSLDKRTCENSLSKVTLYEEQIEDVILSARKFKNELSDSLSGLYILGHSLGANSSILASDSIHFEGIICLSSSPRYILDLMSEQLEYIESLKLSNDILELKEKTRFAQLEMTVNTPDSLLPLNVPAEYWLYLKGIDFVKKFEDNKVKTIIINGSADYQVTKKDASIWKEIESKNTKTQFVLMDGLNHLLSLEEAEMSTPSSYNRENKIDNKVIELITNFIGK